MSPQSGEAFADDVVVTLPRRRGPKSYSAHTGAGRNAALTETVTPPPRSQARLRLRPPHPADVAQSQLFAEILLAEIDDLEDRVAIVERRRSRRKDRDPTELETQPHELRELRHRIAEGKRLLHALRQRFPAD